MRENKNGISGLCIRVTSAPPFGEMTCNGLRIYLERIAYSTKKHDRDEP